MNKRQIVYLKILDSCEKKITIFTKINNHRLSKEELLPQKSSFFWEYLPAVYWNLDQDMKCLLP